jgi:hypothetical protein
VDGRCLCLRIAASECGAIEISAVLAGTERNVDRGGVSVVLKDTSPVGVRIVDRVLDGRDAGDIEVDDDDARGGSCRGTEYGGSSMVDGSSNWRRGGGVRRNAVSPVSSRVCIAKMLNFRRLGGIFPDGAGVALRRR